jgi:hypothetical protein
MSLYDDIQLAFSWLNGEVPLNREKEARAATRKVLGAVSRSLGDSEEKSELDFYLHWLAKAFDPDSVPKSAKHIYTRKAYFKNTSQGAKAARTALKKHIEIATLVQGLRSLGIKRGAVRKVADKFGMESSQVSVICKKPHIRRAMARRFKGPDILT